MPKKGRFESLRVACIIALVGIAAISAPAGQIFLGPANPGAESGLDQWYYGVLGGGLVAVDTEQPATGHNDFVVGITNAADSKINHADLRSVRFPLPTTGKKRGPYTFTFSYKLPDAVKPGDNIEIYFRFFGAGNEEVYLGEQMYRVGAHSRDSEMSQYKTMTVTNIFAPRKAAQADVWIVANVFRPWTSGLAHFDDFSVTAPSVLPWKWILIGVGVCIVVAGLLIWAGFRRQRE